MIFIVLGPVLLYCIVTYFVDPVKFVILMHHTHILHSDAWVPESKGKWG